MRGATARSSRSSTWTCAPRSAAPVRAAPARGRLPPRGPVRRAPLSRRPGARRQHQHDGHAERAGVRGQGGGPQGDLRGQRRHALRRPKRIPAKESAAQSSHPLSPYGISKKVVLDYFGFYQRYRGLDFTAFALATSTGRGRIPRRGRGGGHLRQPDARDQPVTIFGDGNQTRDFVFIDDVVHAFVQSFERGSGKLVNVGTGLESSVSGALPAAGRHHRL